MAALIYYSRNARIFRTYTPPEAVPPDGIRVTAFVHATIQANIRAGKTIELEPDGTPKDVAVLLSLGGMRGAVFEELRTQRSLILNALTGVGFDAMRALEKLPPAPTDPEQVDPDAEEREKQTAILTGVEAARDFLKNITDDSGVLAVTVEQGAEYMRQLILYKYKVYAASAPPEVRNAFREIA